MMIPTTPGDRIARAKAYPFGHPQASYLFRDGGVAPLGDVARAVAGKVAVLASGSNAAPAQLARKYANHAGTVEIPVTRARLRDFDTVFNAHIAAYGSVPATLFPSPGTVLHTFITWLDEAALAIMHATEQPGVNYHFAALDGIDVTVDGLGGLDRAHAYISVAGCIIHDGAPVALAEVPAQRRVYPARTQAEMQDLACALAAPGKAVDDFILENVADAALRAGHEARLAEGARPFDHPGLRILPV